MHRNKVTISDSYLIITINIYKYLTCVILCNSQISMGGWKCYSVFTDEKTDEQEVEQLVLSHTINK